MRSGMDEGHEKHDVNLAEWRANWAETSAFEAVDFAYDAVVEAESAVLDAIGLRATAEEKARKDF